MPFKKPGELCWKTTFTRKCTNSVFGFGLYINTFMFTRLNKLLYLLHIFLVAVQDFVQCCCDFFLLTFLLALLLSALLLVLSSSSKSSSLCIMACSTNRSKHTHIHSMTGFKHQLTKWWRIVYNRSVYLWWLLIFPPVWWVMGSILSLHLLLSRTV